MFFLCQEEINKCYYVVIAKSSFRLAFLDSTDPAKMYVCSRYLDRALLPIVHGLYSHNAAEPYLPWCAVDHAYCLVNPMEDIIDF